MAQGFRHVEHVARLQARLQAQVLGEADADHQLVGGARAEGRPHRDPHIEGTEAVRLDPDLHDR